MVGIVVWSFVEDGDAGKVDVVSGECDKAEAILLTVESKSSKQQERWWWWGSATAPR